MIKAYSWQMIYAEDQSTFDSLWSEMKDKIKGFGYDDVVAYDMENFQEASQAIQEATK